MLKLADRYDLWCISYHSYAFVKESGDQPAVLVERNLTYQQGLDKLKSLPYTYCIKPAA